MNTDTDSGEEYVVEHEELDYEDNVEDSSREADNTVEQNKSVKSGDKSPYDRNRMLRDDKIRALVQELLDEKLKNVAGLQSVAQTSTASSDSPKRTNTGAGNTNMNRQVKSPSDTTLYTPALQRQLTNEKTSLVERIEEELKNKNGNKRSEKEIDNMSMIERISDFVDNIRTEQEQRRDTEKQRSEVHVPGLSGVRQRVEDKVIQAEKFKAAVEEPSGTNQNFIDINLDSRETVHDIHNMNDRLEYLRNVSNGSSSLTEQAQAMGTGKTDDDFYHMTSHLDPTLVTKIEEGKYVDLEKLLPKTRNKIFKAGVGTDSNMLRWVQNDDGVFLAPVQDRDSSINSIRRWEQAFRLYATIYSGAHPK